MKSDFASRFGGGSFMAAASMLWPWVAVGSSGMLVGALAAAIHYHHGAWGALQLDGKTPQAAEALVAALLVDTEYVTCLVRFGRVFGGLGLTVLAWSVLRYRCLRAWNGVAAVMVGFSAMAQAMSLPDCLSYDVPIFHRLVLWHLATGVVRVRRGADPAPMHSGSPGVV